MDVVEAVDGGWEKGAIGPAGGADGGKLTVAAIGTGVLTGNAGVD